MQKIVFDGQQEGEHIFYTVTPHVVPSMISLAVTGIVCLFFLFVLHACFSIIPPAFGIIRFSGIFIGFVVFCIDIYWQWSKYTKTKTYITDRRIIRFELVNPFLVTKRSLFWNEVLKAKGFAPVFFFRTMNIGTIQIEPIAATGEDIKIMYASYYEDLANYIDKILYIYKQSPQSLATIRPFIPQPQGKRE